MAKEMNNMATTNPRLLKWFASKNPFFVFLKIIPLIAVFLYLILSAEQKTTYGVAFFFSGMLVWSFFEYATHRWLYHTVFKNEKVRWFLEAFHLHHHHNLTDYRVLNAGLFLIYPLVLFILLFVYLITANLVLAAWFGLGTIGYYFFYENVHYFIHYKVYTSGYMKFIQQYHLHHHYKRWNKNYGNTLTFWDRLLGTYDPGYKQFVITEEIALDLIEH